MTRYERCGLWAAVILFSAGGCSDQSAPADTGGLTDAALVDTVFGDPRVSAPPPPPDKSLTLSEYVEGGLPAPDRIWSGADLARAAAALTRIAQTDASRLPRYRSDRSGKAFARLTADENLDIYRDPSLPLDQRFPEALTYIQSTNELLKLYLAALNQGAVGGGELVEFLGAQLRASVVMLGLVDEFLPTLDKEDPTYPVRMAGLQRMKSGLSSVVAGGLQTLSESNAYRTADLKRLVGYMEDTFPEILPKIGELSRTETLIRVRTLRDDPRMKHLRPELDALASTVEESVAGG